MTEQQTKIDPETFAYHFMETIHRPEIDLTGYYLIQKFNHLENDFFVEDHAKPISKYQRILSELNKY